MSFFVDKSLFVVYTYISKLEKIIAVERHLVKGQSFSFPPTAEKDIDHLYCGC